MQETVNLFFSEAGELLEEHNVLRTLRHPPLEPDRLAHDFMVALSSSRHSFRRFCAAPSASDEPEYRIFHLTSFSPYSFVFCEKSLVRGSAIVIAYPGRYLSDFYPYMSPSYHHFRKITSRIIGEFFEIFHRGYGDITELSPGGFLSLAHVPLLIETILKEGCAPCYADLRRITESILSCSDAIHAYPADEFSLSVTYCEERMEQMRLDADFGKDSASIVNFATVPYVYLFTMALHAFHILSDSHRTEITLHYLPDSAEVELTTVIRTSLEENLFTEIGDLSLLSPALDSMAKLSSIIAFASLVSTNVRYHAKDRRLTVSFGLGHGIQFVPDYKYSDPYSAVPSVVSEALHLLSLAETECPSQ